MITISNTLTKEEEGKTEADFLPNLNQDIPCIEISHDILEMTNGIIGFEYIKHYSFEMQDGGVLYKVEGQPDNSPVFYLINPYLIVPHYSLSMRDDEYELIGSPEFDDIVVFAILTLRENMSATTCNLLGPLVINNKKGTMIQVINDSGDWGTKHLLSNGEKVVELHIDSGAQADEETKE